MFEASFSQRTTTERRRQMDMTFSPIVASSVWIRHRAGALMCKPAATA
jgi:hypothetical protein